MRKAGAEKDDSMTNAETNDKAATVAAQGAHVPPEKALSKKGDSKKKGAPKAKKSAKAPKKGPTAARGRAPKGETDRKSAGRGRRVDLGGGRSIKKKTRSWTPRAGRRTPCGDS